MTGDMTRRVPWSNEYLRSSTDLDTGVEMKAYDFVINSTYYANDQRMQNGSKVLVKILTSSSRTYHCSLKRLVRN